MLSSMRNQVLGLACLRNGFSPSDGRGFDDLSTDDRSAILRCFATSLDVAELCRAFQNTMSVLLNEISLTDITLANRIEASLAEIVRSSSQTSAVKAHRSIPSTT